MFQQLVAHPHGQEGAVILTALAILHRATQEMTLVSNRRWSPQIPFCGLSYSLAFPSRPVTEPGRPNSGLETIQRRGHHPMVRVLLELLQQLARLVGFVVAGPIAHQATKDFGAAHPHRAIGVFDCQGG